MLSAAFRRAGVDFESSAMHATLVLGACLLQDLFPRAPGTERFAALMPQLSDAGAGVAAERRNCLALDWSPTVVRLGPCEQDLERHAAHSVTKERRRMLHLTSACGARTRWRRLMHMCAAAHSSHSPLVLGCALRNTLTLPHPLLTSPQAL